MKNEHMEAGGAGLAGSREISGWRRGAAAIVEELFVQVDSQHWDLLLELREGLLRGADWVATLNCFQTCRERMETDVYLPFFRLRRLLGAGLQLQVEGGGPVCSHQALGQMLRRTRRPVEVWQRLLQREWFEFGDDATWGCNHGLRIIERGAAR